MSTQPPPHDHPGRNAVFSIAGLSADKQTALLESQEALGFKLVAANNNFVYLYKEESGGH